MMRYLLIILGIGFLIPAYSQNYQTVSSTEVKLFISEGYESVVRGYRIDSLKVLGGDTILYPSRTIQNNGGDPAQGLECYDVTGSSMFGDHVRIMPNGTNLFFNQNGDTIRIETQTQTGETWEVWSGSDYSIYGEMLETELQDVFGVADSVRSIKLNAYDDDMNLVGSFEFNDYLILISENYGLLTAFNFYAFPNLHEDYFSYEAERYTLYGIENQGLGKSNLTTFAIFDFQPGDIIHSEFVNLYTGQGIIRKRKEEYTSRADFGADSIVYLRNITTITYNYDGTNDADITVSSYTQSPKTVIPISYLDKLPGLPIGGSANEYPEYYSVAMIDGEIPKKRNLEMAYPGGTLYYDSSQDCYINGVDGICGQGQGHKYLKGLGGPYYNCDFGAGISHSNSLKYFMKNGEEWGTPIDFSVSLVEIENQTDFDLFPNPATGKLNLILFDALLPAVVEIVDLNGRTAIIKTIETAETEIDISRLQSGLYFVRFPFSGNKSTRKLIIR